ncbi:MAG: queuosine precursor transporter [Desulfurococcaceae archaeon]
MEVWLFWVMGLTLSTCTGAFLVRRFRDSYGYPVLVSLYVAFILVSNILASRLVVYNLFGVVAVTAGATLIFPFVAQIVDMVNEVYGRKASYMAVLITLMVNIIASTLIWHVACEEPALEEMGLSRDLAVVYDEAWRFYMLQTPRIVVASYTAFWVANILDAKIFADLKRHFYVKYKEAYKDVKIVTTFVLVRSIISDLVNMVVDSLVFFPLAYALTVPWEVLPEVILGGTYVKVVIILLTQPFLIAYRLLIRDVPRVID